MWMSGFRYIIASTITVQTIIQNNNEKMQEKMRLKTKHFVAEQTKLQGKGAQEKEKKDQERKKKIKEFIENDQKKKREAEEEKMAAARHDTKE